MLTLRELTVDKRHDDEAALVHFFLLSINMHSFFFLLVLLSFAPLESKKDEWNHFKQLYNRHFDDVAEEISRRTIFEERVAMIERHNREAARGWHSYTLKINQFADLVERRPRLPAHPRPPSRFRNAKKSSSRRPTKSEGTSTQR